MHLPGHLSIALIQHALPPLARRRETLPPLLLATILPDVIDKTLGYVLKVMPSGRHAAHNLPALLGSSLLVTVVTNRRSGLAWLLGYGGHLLADNPRRLPWLFPFKRYTFQKKRFNFGWRRFWSELGWLGLTVGVYWLTSKSNCNSPESCYNSDQSK